MKTPKLVTATQSELDEILALARAAFPPRQYQLLESILGTFAYVMVALQNARTSIKRFRQMLFGARTESRANVLGEAVIDVEDAAAGTANGAVDATVVSDAAPAADLPEAACDSLPVKPKRRGHGRNGAQAYSGAPVVEVALTGPASGQVCPQCEIGRVYAWPPRTIVKVTGQPPIGGTVYKLQQRRCRACDALFTAPMPQGVTAGAKHDERCVCMLILMRYGYGMPSYRLEALQSNLNIPMPDATQWDLVEASLPGPKAAYEELIRQAAQAELLHNDDTSARILSLMVERKKIEAAGQEPEARAINTSGIVAVLRTSDREIKVVLFFTGHAHAGDNLGAVLAKRAAELEAPMHMSDGLALNIPKDVCHRAVQLPGPRPPQVCRGGGPLPCRMSPRNRGAGQGLRQRCALRREGDVARGASRVPPGP